MQPTPRDLRFEHVYFPSIINCCDYFSEYLLNILIVMRRWCLKYCIYIYFVETKGSLRYYRGVKT